jgi:hypothetical protein
MGASKTPRNCRHKRVHAQRRRANSQWWRRPGSPAIDCTARIRLAILLALSQPDGSGLLQGFPAPFVLRRPCCGLGLRRCAAKHTPISQRGRGRNLEHPSRTDSSMARNHPSHAGGNLVAIGPARVSRRGREGHSRLPISALLARQAEFMGRGSSYCGSRSMPYSIPPERATS